MKMKFILFLGLSLFLINCPFGRNSSNEDGLIDGKTFDEACRDLSEFKNCTNEIDAQSSVSKTALTLALKNCASLHITAVDDLAGDYGAEVDLTPEEISQRSVAWQEVGKQCADKASNQESKACMINAVTVFREQACQTNLVCPQGVDSC